MLRKWFLDKQKYTWNRNTRDGMFQWFRCAPQATWVAWVALVHGRLRQALAVLGIFSAFLYLLLHFQVEDPKVDDPEDHPDDDDDTTRKTTPMTTTTTAETTTAETTTAETTTAEMTTLETMTWKTEKQKNKRLQNKAQKNIKHNT
ncbi:unnamed protein product [Ranitomeya imitator]|uniref:Uncharacterized protein n=1 Tax=Ranitomeya imitator TaxID=111125 RepID=A0ABN9LRL6_9NEOB|nr:unnamed protein product [Ranitomeya imitator]